MKSFSVLTAFVVAASFACTAYRSAGSHPVANGSSTPSLSNTQNTNGIGPQEKPACSLTLAAAPAINGLRLGLTADEVLELFPGSKDDAEVRADLARKPNQFGGSNFLIRPAKYESKGKFPNVSQITFSLFDGRISGFNLDYAGVNWPHVDQFLAKFLEGTNLPPADQWQAYPGLENQLKVLTCDEFEVRVFAGVQGGNLNYVLIKDLIAEKKLKDRRAKARAQATPTPNR